MGQIKVPGLRTRIALALAVIMFLFIVVTELSISRLVRVGMMRQAELTERMDNSRVKESLERDLAQLRRLTFFYLVIGSVCCLALGSLAITRLVVRPLRQLNRALDRVGAGYLDTQVPIAGAAELVDLGVAFNQMTSKLRKQQVELEDKIQEVESSAKELREAQESLIRAARLASVGTLAAGVAHEIGNPLAGVLGLLEALETGADEETAARYHALMKKEIKRIDKIIGDLLTYARPSPRGADELASTTLEEVIEHLRELLSAQRLFDQVEILSELDAGPWSVALSRDDLTQVLLNLFLNAAQAMEGKGRIQICAERTTKPALSRTTKVRDAVRILVTDTGPGIPDEHVERIYDPFFSGKSKRPGTGLGLAICQSICHRAGGDISLVREHGTGSCFALILPPAS